MQLRAALKGTQPWQQSPAGRDPSLWEVVRSGTGKIEGDSRCTAVSMSSVPLSRDNHLHLDNVAGAGLGCTGERPPCQVGATAELYPGVRDQSQLGKKCHVGYQMLSWRGDWAYQAGWDVFTGDMEIGSGAWAG